MPGHLRPFVEQMLDILDGCPVIQTAMWPFLIVFFPPSFDDVFGFLQPREPVLVQAFVTELAIEAFAERILYWLARLDEM